MTRPSRALRRVGVVGIALALAAATTAAPALAKTPAKDRSVDCIDYGEIPQAPKGAIPRDDSHIVKQDPLAQAAAETVSAAAEQVPQTPIPGFDVTIPVVFHEIIKDHGNGGGDLSDARVAAQIAALNTAYLGTGFQFALEDNTETVQPEWFNMSVTKGAAVRFVRGSGKEIKMKQLLATQDPGTLDVYSAHLGKILLGWAWLPSLFTGDDPLPRYFDGVVIDFRTVPAVPGETAEDGDQSVFPPNTYEQGDTLTHEVGHWFELLHTFDGGCSGVGWDAGDMVGDTPAEASPNFECPPPGQPNTRDTCPADPGLDPINNFMDYSFDSCLTVFTAGQAARMQYAWTTYRM